MKKLVIIILVIVLGYYLMQTGEAIEIPDEAIRLRVIANSDSEYDQEIKMKVSEKLQSRLYNLLKNTKGLQEAESIINKNMSNIESDIKNLLNNEGYTLGYKINYGLNYFPEKKYKGVTYKEGEYESLVVTLGEGKGKNWWCVLFPPLCILEAEESTEVEYKFFIKEMIDKYL